MVFKATDQAGESKKLALSLPIDHNILLFKTATISIWSGWLVTKYLDYPGSPKPVPVPAQPVRLSATPAEVRHRAPTLGEHTDEILLGLGFTEDELAAFRLASVI